MQKKVVVTGGLGYIGSHICEELIRSGHTPIIIDNMEHSKMETYNYLNNQTSDGIQLHRIDLRNISGLHYALKYSKYDGVIHTAGYKNASASLKHPQKYFQNNITSTLNVITECKVPIVFSSSASVYGDNNSLSIQENEPLRPKTPYAYSKRVSEEMFYDMKSVIILRYFNVIGNGDHIILGEHKNPNAKNVLYHMFKSAWNFETFTINGKDYNSVDGTPIRDFIDVRDLAKAHVVAIEDAMRTNLGVRTYNVGSGSGTTILELAKLFGKVQYQFGKRMKADIERSVADISLIDADLGWVPNIPIQDSINSAWKRYRMINENI